MRNGLNEQTLSSSASFEAFADLSTDLIVSFKASRKSNAVSRSVNPIPSRIDRVESRSYSQEWL